MLHYCSVALMLHISAAPVFVFHEHVVAFRSVTNLILGNTALMDYATGIDSTYGMLAVKRRYVRTGEITMNRQMP